MKILMITDLYPPIAMGGYEISCQETANELRRRGHDIIILTSKQGIDHGRVEGNIYRLLFPNELNDPIKLNGNDLFRLRRRYYQFQWAFKSRENYAITQSLIATTQPDLAFIWNMGNIGIGPLLAVQDQDIPKVFNIGDYWLVRFKSELYDDANHIKRMIRSAIVGMKDFYQLDFKHLLVVSKSLKQIYIERGFPEKNIHVIPVGIRSSLILPIVELRDIPRNRNGTIKLLFVGRIVPEKGPDVAINALEVLIRKHGMRNIKLDFIGQGPEEYTLSLKSMISEFNLEENVNFLGWMEHSQILDIYPDYDALLFPSRWIEPFGMTVLEAMARGLPVIASRRGGPTEIIRDGEDGLLVSPDEPVALAEAVLQLVQNDNLTQKIRISGIKTVNERYTLEFIVGRNLEYIQTVLASSRITKDQKEK